MRTKIFLIEGQYQLAQRITLGEYERVNLDTLTQVLALRDGHAISAYDPQNVSETTEHQIQISDFLESLEQEDCQHMLASEYADAIVERGQYDIKAVEGFALMTEWVYDMVHALHKTANRICVRVRCALPKDRWMIINGSRYEWDEAMKILCPNPSLG